MSASIAAAPEKLFGLVELDSAGRVLYSRIEKDAAAGGGVADFRGYDFYSEVAHFRNVEELRRHLDAFRLSSRPAETIDFDCDYEDGPVRVRVLMTRISEQTERDATKSILVHIRRAL